ncbi:MAG TPA: hypothetical protein VI094_14275 [Propionibacteriaceae bacterium]
MIYAPDDASDIAFDQAFGWSQAVPGVPGKAEARDHFGAAVGFFGEHLAVGVADEDVGASSNAGVVQLFRWSSTAPLPTGEVKQYTPGVRGVVETGDRSGAAVAVAISAALTDRSKLLLGYRARTSRSAGQHESMLEPSRSLRRPQYDPCAVSVDQGTVLANTPETGDRLGPRWHSDGTPTTTMTRAIGHSLVCRGKMALLASCNPRQIGSGANSTDIVLAGAFNASVGYSRGDVAGTSYGAVIASPAGE